MYSSVYRTDYLQCLSNYIYLLAPSWPNRIRPSSSDRQPYHAPCLDNSRDAADSSGEAINATLHCRSGIQMCQDTPEWRGPYLNRRGITLLHSAQRTSDRDHTVTDTGWRRKGSPTQPSGGIMEGLKLQSRALIAAMMDTPTRLGG